MIIIKRGSVNFLIGQKGINQNCLDKFCQRILIDSKKNQGDILGPYWFIYFILNTILQWYTKIIISVYKKDLLVTSTCVRKNKYL